MLARSFVRDLGLIASGIAAPLALLAATACSSSASHKPEADPAKVVSLMKTIDRNTPGPGDAPDCKPADMIGGATMTQVTMLKLGGIPATPGAERDDWINPTEVDSPAARELLDPATPVVTKRQAAYELLNAPFILVYRVDLVEAPMAMGIKDIRRGTVSMRALRYDRQGRIVCGKLVNFQQTLAKSDWAIVKSDLAVMDPKVAKVLRDDLHDVMLKHIAALGRPE